MNYRKLFPEEISQLKQQNCIAIDKWESILVSQSFTADNIRNVTFSGTNHLGCFTAKINTNNIHDFSGIYNAHIHNCTINDQAYIKNIGCCIKNYKIGENSIIENVDLLLVENESSFGNGESVYPVNEGGGREVLLYNKLSVHTAYMMTFYTDKEILTSRLKEMITYYATQIKSSTGTIEANTVIKNCRTIKNVNIGNSAHIEGITLLEEGTVNSTANSPTYVGHSVNACRFIFSNSSNISDGAYLRHCFVGQGCEVGNNFSAENSLFFANSQCLQGEACSIFAGPYTVTHHKSTLLIAGYYSFFNAGSATNQSNHMYKLGPVHQGIIERGSKTGSGSYVLWPAKIGAFTMILGHHYGNPDTSELPFSYLIENDEKSVLMPGQNIFTVGTARDVEKWPLRDQRKGDLLTDHITTEALNPFTINKIIAGIKILNQMNEKVSPQVKTLMYKNTQISLSSINRGIKLYEQALIKYIGDKLINLLKHTNFDKLINLDFSLDKIDEWIDLGGMICKKSDLSHLMKQVENNSADIDELNTLYSSMYTKYNELKTEHVFQVLSSYFAINIKLCSKQNIIDFLNNWLSNNEKITSSIIIDAKKEFNIKSKIGFGIDGDAKEKDIDFNNVRGNIDTNSFIQSLNKELKKVNTTGEKIIKSLL